MLNSVPDHTFKLRCAPSVPDDPTDAPETFEWEDLTTDDLFAGRNVVVFALPAAFSPVCTLSHFPPYENKFRQFQALGVDEVIGLTVNDPFVIEAWSKVLKNECVRVVPDGTGEFARKMGMLVDRSKEGLGLRTWRYSMYVEDRQIKKFFLEPGFGKNVSGDPFEVSDADTMLSYLKIMKETL